MAELVVGIVVGVVASAGVFAVFVAVWGREL